MRGSKLDASLISLLSSVRDNALAVGSPASVGVEETSCDRCVCPCLFVGEAVSAFLILSDPAAVGRHDVSLIAHVSPEIVYPSFSVETSPDTQYQSNI